ncbi:IS3 family transposase [Bacteroidota bacterium]
MRRRYEFIKKRSNEFSTRVLCELMKVSKSSYYKYLRRKPSRREESNKKILKEIKKIYQESKGRYGSPRITVAINRRGIKCDRKRIARIMKEEGILAKTRKKYKITTNSKHKLPVAENLVRQNFRADKPNKIWAGDITYVWTKEGWLYLAAILDLYSRKIIGWQISKYLDKKLVIEALRKAIEARSVLKGMIFHSDQGVQYASDEFKETLRNNGILQSMSRRGNCYDNAVAESFFHTLKTELIYFERYNTKDEARTSIFEYIEIFYNRKRIHSSIGYLTPEEFENYNKLTK